MDNKLAEYDKDGKPKHDLRRLLQLDSQPRPQPVASQGESNRAVAAGYASKRKKPNPLTDEQVAAAWRKQIDDVAEGMGGLISYHLPETPLKNYG